MVLVHHVPDELGRLVAGRGVEATDEAQAAVMTWHPSICQKFPKPI